MTETALEGSGWQLEGNAADAYEAYLVPAIFDSLTQRLLHLAKVGRGQKVLDVACGTGVVSRAATRKVGDTGEVAGVDLNPDMLAAAKRAADARGLFIDFRQADVAALPFEDDHFDVALCQEAVQFFPDPSAALSEMRRVTAPGGTVAFSVFRSLSHHPVYDRLAALLGEHVGAEAEAMMASPFSFGGPEKIRALADAAGLEDVTVRFVVNEERFPSVEEFLRQEAASSPLAGPLSRLDDERTEALLDELHEVLTPHLDDCGLVFHNETQVVTAQV